MQSPEGLEDEEVLERLKKEPVNKTAVSDQNSPS